MRGRCLSLTLLVGFASGHAAFAAPTQDTIIATAGSMQITPSRLILSELGVSLESGGASAFLPDAVFAMTVVGDHPYRMIAANIPVDLSLSLASRSGMRVAAAGLRLIAAEPGVGHDYALADRASGQVWFTVNGGSFAYNAEAQTLSIGQAWLRATDELAAQLQTPRLAGNLVATLDLFAETAVIRTDPLAGTTELESHAPAGPGDGGGPRAGGDVVYQNVSDVGRYGPVGTIQAYIFGTGTCNIGNQNISWLSNGTPGVAFNVFRLHNGRMMQLGQSFVKTACCAAAGNGCGLACNGQGGSVLGAGCLDVYSSGWNAQQNRLMPRSQINPFTGSFGVIPAGSGNAIWRRCQVEQAELSAANFPGALFFGEGVYVGTEDCTFNNRNNNASYRRVTVDASYNMSVTGSTVLYQPAITAWRANGLGVGVPDPRVNDVIVDVPSEGRFHVAYKVTDNQNGTWTYDYAIYNLTSDRAGGSLEVPIAPGTLVTNIGFHDVDYHSGEPYDNTDWVIVSGATSVLWRSPQTFAQNPNSNALRWGTMYNFWFTANRGPTPGDVTLGLFKSGGVPSVAFSAATPGGTGGSLVGDLDNDGDVDLDDLTMLLSDFGCTPLSPQWPCEGDVNGDERTDIDDLTLLLANFGAQG